MELQELRDEPLLAATPAGFTLAEVVVRLVRPDERIKWDGRSPTTDEPPQHQGASQLVSEIG